MTFPEGVAEALMIGIDDEGNLYIATKMDDQDTLDLLQDAFDIMAENFTTERFTMQ